VAKVSEADLSEIISLFEPVYFTKKSYIIKEQEENKYMYFIYKGLVRVFYVIDDKQINHWFDSEGDFIGNLYYVTTGYPSFHNYETLENTWLLRAKHSDLNKLFKRVPIAEHIARKFMELYYVENLHQVMDMKSLSADTRYENFIKRFSNLVARIPQKHIANYLGLTQETLSRIRSKRS
jgi:CRP-like cAMP-binding protein